MTWICYVGIELSAHVQYALLGIEAVMLVASRSSRSCGSGPGTVPPPRSRRRGRGSTRSRSPSPSALADGVLLAVFIYWGWDTAVSVNEETKDRAHTPGRAAVLSTLLLLAIYSMVTVAAQAFSGIGDTGIGLGNPDNAGDVLSVLGHAVFGSSVSAPD